MTGIWWTSASIEIFLCSLTATTTHLLMSLGQTLFHRYLGHRGIGGRFRENHIHIHHTHYSGDHVVSEYYLNEEANNTLFFLIPVTLVISLGYLVLPLDLFIAQLTAMSISFYVHLYFDKHYHVAGSWLGRFAWFRRKQQWPRSPRSHPRNPRLSNSVSSRSVLARRCSRETATLEGWMTCASIPCASSQRASQKPSRPASKATVTRVIVRPALTASSRQRCSTASSRSGLGSSFWRG